MRDLSSTDATPDEAIALQLGRPVRCSDGPVGSLSDVVIDPEERRATIRSFSYVGLDKFPQSDERSDIGVEDTQVVPSFGAAEFGDFGADLWTGYTVTYDRIPPGSAELRSSSVAVTGAGEELGTVGGFLVEGGRLTHVVLHRTRLSRTGTASIPVDSITAIETDRITVAE